MSTKDLPYKNKGDLINGSIQGHLVRLTIPMIWGLLAIISVQLADTYFISLLGTTELAAISFTFPVTMILTHIVFGFNVAISSVVSRLIGSKKTNDARRVTLHGVMTAFFFSVFVSVLCFELLEPLFLWLGATEEILPIVMSYMPIWLIACAILAIPVTGNSAMRAHGDASVPAIIMIMIALINFVLDPVLIFGLLGLPALGVQGAAVATLVAYITGLLVGVYMLVFHKKLVPLDGLHFDKFGDSLKRLLVIAVPAGLANIVMPLTNAVIVSLLAVYGPEAVAAYGVATRVEAMAFLVVMALAVGMAPVIGQNWGAEKYERVHKTINLALGFNVVWSLLMAVIIGVFAHELAGIFSDDETVIHYAVLFFWIVPFSYALGNLVFGWSSSFNAMGMPKRSFVMIVVKSFVMTLPAVYVGSHMAGPVGIFIALAGVNLVSGLLFHIVSWRHCLRCEADSGQEQVLVAS